MLASVLAGLVGGAGLFLLGMELTTLGLQPGCGPHGGAEPAPADAAG